MHKLPTAKRAMILSMLVEGMSMRSISRTVGVSINTVTKLLVDAGHACAAYHDETVRNVKSHRVQCDEIWSFCYAKDKNVPVAKAAPKGAGDVWTWTAIDSDSKMILSYEVGDRSSATAIEFMDDLRGRLVNRVQLTTDGHKAYLEAVEGAFGGDVDFTPTHQALRRTYRQEGSRTQVLTRGVRWHKNTDRGRQPSAQAYQHVLRGTPEPYDANGHAPVHPPN